MAKFKQPNDIVLTNAWYSFFSPADISKAFSKKDTQASDSETEFSREEQGHSASNYLREQYEKYINLLKLLKFSVKTGASLGFNKQRLLEAIKQLPGYQHHLAFAGGFIIRLANGSTLFAKGNMIAFDNVSEKTLSSVMELAKKAGAHSIDLGLLPAQAQEVAAKKASEYGLRVYGYQPKPEESRQYSPFKTSPRPIR